MRQRGPVLIVLLAAQVWVAGCASEPTESVPSAASTEPSSAPELSPEPEPEPEVPTPEPLPLPDPPEGLEAEDTAENAVLAALYFVDLINYMQSTGDTELFEQISVPVCEPCERFAAIQTDRREAGGYLVGNSFAFQDAVASRTGDGLAWVVQGNMAVSDGYEVANGEVERRISGEVEEGFRLGVQIVEGTWMLLTFARG